MKFASLLIDMNFIGQAKTLRTQRKTFNRYAMFLGSICPQGMSLIVYRRLCPA